MGKRGRPRKNPIDGIPNYVKQQREEIELERKINKLMKLAEMKMMQQAMEISQAKPVEGDFLRLTGRMGANNYDINIKTMEDQRIAANLLNQFGISIIRKDH